MKNGPAPEREESSAVLAPIPIPIPAPVSASGPLGIALSGGGVRAMAFHAGMLTWLAEQRALEEIGHISTVSGGSLLIALVLRCNDWRWPSSREWRDRVLPLIRESLIRTSLSGHTLKQLMRPANWRMLNERALMLAETIERQWGVDIRLHQLPHRPIWTINGTTVETGNPLAIRQGFLTDAALGFAAAPQIKLASAVAMSAAVPGSIGPLTLSAHAYDWRDASGQTITPAFEALNVYDGGLYDNLGIEALFDPATQRFTEAAAGLEALIVSNAGHLPVRAASKSAVHPKRLYRFAELQFTTLNDLRARAFRNFVATGQGAGTYVRLGLSSPESALTLADFNRVRTYPTQLGRIKAHDFDRIARHGYETVREAAAKDGLRLNSGS